MIYLNNATTSFPKSAAALTALEQALTRPPADVRHCPAGEADIAQARRAVARVLAVAPEHVFFVSDATTALNLVLRGVLADDDPCVLDDRPHNAVTRTLHGSGHRAWGVVPLYGPQERPDPQAFVAGVPPRAALAVLTTASNVSGALDGPAETIELLRRERPGCAVLIDACQAAGVIEPAQLVGEAEFVVFTGHKALHALPGAAVLIARRPLRPLLFGGTGSHSAALELPTDGRHHVEVGTPNLPAILALSAALGDSAAHWADHRAAIDANVARLWEGLATVPGLVRLGRPPGPDRGGIVACRTTVGTPEEDWAPQLRARGIVTRGGLHCAPVQHGVLGLLPQGSLRLSVSRYTTAGELDEALAALRDCGRTLASPPVRRAGPRPPSLTTSPAQPAAMPQPATTPEPGPAALPTPTPLPQPEPTPTPTPWPTPLARRPRLVIAEVAPCTELPGRLMLEGTFVDAALPDLSATLRACDWAVTDLPGGQLLSASRQGMQLLLAATGDYSLARVADRAAAEAALAELALRLARTLQDEDLRRTAHDR